MSKSVRKHGRYPWAGILSLCAMIVTGHLVAIGLNGEALFSHWFPLLEDCRLLTLAGMIVIFIYSFIYFYNNLPRLFGVRSLSRTECEPRRAMILLLSKPNLRPEEDTFDFPLTLRSTGEQATLKGDRLNEDIAELDKVWWNWQHLLRAILPHLSKLQHVFIIGSDGENGSQKDVEHARKVIKQYCSSADVKATEKGVDFENFYDLVECLQKTIDEYLKNELEEDDITIDVTGGLKTASIAGAAATLNRHVRFQYITTTPPYRCWSYDIGYQPPARSE